MDIKIDTPIEVTETQYKNLMYKCSGMVAGREENGKFYIKVWMMRYVDFIKQVAGFK